MKVRAMRLITQTRPPVAAAYTPTPVPGTVPG